MLGGGHHDLPYIDFNMTGKSNASTYFDTGYIPNSATTVETTFSDVIDCICATGHQHGCRTGWVQNAF